MVLKKIPFLRILAPFIAGILFSIYYSLNFVNSFVILSGLALLTTFYLLKNRFPIFKKAFTICSDAFLFCFAIALVNQSRMSSQTDFYGNFSRKDSLNKIIATVNDIPVEKEKWIKYQLKVLEIKNGENYTQASGNLIVYFRKHSNLNIKHGQTLLLNVNLIETDSPKNPYEFDYRAYLENKQIYHICFADSFSYHILKVEPQLNSVWQFGLDIKQQLLSALKNCGLTTDAYSICAALLTGYDDDIDKSIMEAFSHSGTLHVLSVSGLHTGLIYLVLSFLFDFVDRNKNKKLIRFIFITVCLWLFALITGFSAPVLRAVIMFNLLGVGNIFFRNDKYNHINILLVSAFILLCYNPFFICDVGFLLSYFALLGILIFGPVFQSMYTPENKILKYTWQSVTTSFAATLSTLPITLFYFKQFQLWFFVCNLIVVPATFMLLLLALLAIFKIHFVSLIINTSVKWLITFINLFNTSSGGFIDGIDFAVADALLLSLLIVLACLAIQFRSYRYFVYSFLLLLFWQLNGIVQAFNSKNSSLLTVYNIKKEAAYSVKNKNVVLLDTSGQTNFKYHVNPHLISFNYPEIKNEKFNLLASKRGFVLFLNRKNKWPQIAYNKISVLVVSNNFTLKEPDLEQFSGLKTLIADGSNNRFKVQQLAKLCSKFGIDFYSTAQQGAYMLNLQ